MFLDVIVELGVVIARLARLSRLFLAKSIFGPARAATRRREPGRAVTRAARAGNATARARVDARIASDGSIDDDDDARETSFDASFESASPTGTNAGRDDPRRADVDAREA